jgi:hypothetical protein
VRLGFETRTIFMSRLLSRLTSNLAPVSKLLHCVFCVNKVFPKCGRTQDRRGHSQRFCRNNYGTTLSELMQPIASCLSQRSRFTPWTFSVVFVTDKKEALILVFLSCFGFMSFIISPLVLIHSSFIRGVFNRAVRGRSCTPY